VPELLERECTPHFSIKKKKILLFIYRFGRGPAGEEEERSNTENKKTWKNLKRERKN